MVGPSAQLWIGSFPSIRPKKLWPTWNKDVERQGRRRGEMSTPCVGEDVTRRVHPLAAVRVGRMLIRRACNRITTRTGRTGGRRKRKGRRPLGRTRRHTRAMTCTPTKDRARTGRSAGFPSHAVAEAARSGPSGRRSRRDSKWPDPDAWPGATSLREAFRSSRRRRTPGHGSSPGRTGSHLCARSTDARRRRHR